MLLVTSKLGCRSAQKIIKITARPLWPLLFRVEFWGRRVLGSLSFGVIEFSCRVLGSLSFGVVLGSLSFGVVEFWGC